MRDVDIADCFTDPALLDDPLPYFEHQQQLRRQRHGIPDFPEVVLRMEPPVESNFRGGTRRHEHEPTCLLRGLRELHPEIVPPRC